MPQCKQCQTEFEIRNKDRAFYSQIKVPEPTHCPDCRNMRRCAWRNERVLYVRPCDLCGERTLSTYQAESPFTVYCTKCWWSDRWDPESFAQDFDFKRPFFEQYGELVKKVPRIAVMARTTENSDFCNEVEELKDSYMAICTFYGQRVFYTYWMGWCNDSVDCSYTLKSELCYECQDLQQGYGCRYVYNSQNMTDCAFCFACFDCTNCFMSVNLRNKSYCIKNKQYTKEGYEREMKKYTLSSYQATQQLAKEFWKFVQQFPRRFAYIRNSENCIGDYITDSKDVYWGFDTFGQENSSYVFDAGQAKDSMDLLQSGVDCSLMYETHSLGWAYNIHFANWTWQGSELEYVDACHDSHDIFGCVGMRKKRHCILNKQYREEEYKALRIKIIEHMRTTGEYGEFFPMTLSPYAYNETIAQQWYPKKQAEAEQSV